MAQHQKTNKCQETDMDGVVGTTQPNIVSTRHEQRGPSAGPEGGPISTSFDEFSSYDRGGSPGL